MDEKRFVKIKETTNEGIETHPNSDTLSLLVCIFYEMYLFIIVLQFEKEY